MESKCLSTPSDPSVCVLCSFTSPLPSSNINKHSSYSSSSFPFPKKKKSEVGMIVWKILLRHYSLTHSLVLLLLLLLPRSRHHDQEEQQQEGQSSASWWSGKEKGHCCLAILWRDVCLLVLLVSDDACCEIFFFVFERARWLGRWRFLFRGRYCFWIFPIEEEMSVFFSSFYLVWLPLCR